MAKRHPLHEKVGELLKGFIEIKGKDFDIRLDEACEYPKSEEKKQQIPLFLDEKKRENNFCKVDAMLLEGKKIAVIIEIEESKSGPTIIFGKYLTTAMSDCYMRGKDEIKIADKSVRFIQIIDTKKRNEQKTKMEDKYSLIAKKINENLYGCVKDYKIICVNEDKIKEKAELEKFKEKFYDALEGK